MTYKHLTTRELTLIADFWNQGTKAYQAAKLLKRSQETIYRVYRFLNRGKMNSTYNPINVISDVVDVNNLSRLKMRLTTLMNRLKLAGHPIRLLVVRNRQLVVVCELFIGCLLVVNMISTSNSYR